MACFLCRSLSFCPNQTSHATRSRCVHRVTCIRATREQSAPHASETDASQQLALLETDAKEPLKVWSGTRQQHNTATLLHCNTTAARARPLDPRGCASLDCFSRFPQTEWVSRKFEIHGYDLGKLARKGEGAVLTRLSPSLFAILSHLESRAATRPRWQPRAARVPAAAACAPRCFVDIFLLH